MKLLTHLVFGAAALAVAGCSPKKNPDPKVGAPAQAAVAAANEGTVPASPVGSAGAPAKLSLPVIAPAPTWTLKDLNGAPVSSDAFKGKVVVVDFWATWCPPCRAEIPGYVDLTRKYGDKLVIVGMSIDEGGPKVVQDFVKKFGVTYPIVMADEAVVSAFGGMDSIPTTFLIDQQGRIRDRKNGAEPTAEYERKIAALLN